MKILIEDFPRHIGHAIFGATKQKLNMGNEFIMRAVIVGMGGSGIGATIVENLTREYQYKSITIVKGNLLPSFVNPETLVIACSYSGNTQETLLCLQNAKKAGAKIVCITSGGKMEEMAFENKWDCILLPRNMPPRTCLGFSIVHLLFTLHKFAVIRGNFKDHLQSTVELLQEKQEFIRNQAHNFARTLYGKLPVIYAPEDMEGVAIRFKQQLNENAKMLAWTGIIPEMNHNELVGWADKRQNIAVVFLRNSCECLSPEVAVRFRITKQMLVQKVNTMVEIEAEGSNLFEQTFYHIHMEDWISYYLAILKKVDPFEIKAVERLKEALK